MRGFLQPVSFLPVAAPLDTQPVAATLFPSAPVFRLEDMSLYGSYKFTEDVPKERNINATGGNSSKSVSSMMYDSVKEYTDNQINLQYDLYTKYKLTLPSIGYTGTVVDFVTNCIIFVDSLFEASTPKHFTKAILVFIKGLTRRDYFDIFSSFIPVIRTVFKTCFGFWNTDFNFKFDDQINATMDVPSHDSHDFLRNMQRVRITRDNLVKSDFCKRFMSFCGMIICLPIFSNYDIDLTCLGFTEAYAKKFKNQHQYTHVVQIMDGILMDVHYFVEKVAICVEARDIGYLLYDDVERRAYDKMFNFISYYYNKLNCIDSAVCTYVNEHGETINVDCNLGWYYDQCDKLLRLNEKMSNAHEDASVRAEWKSQHGFLERCKLASGDKLRVMSERDQPFAWCICGSPGIGKTALNHRFLEMCFENDIYIFKRRSERYDSKMMWVYPQTEEFMSEFRTSHKVCHLDDVGQFKSEYNQQMKGGLITKTLDLVNSVPYSTKQAHLADKGQIPFRSDYVTMTSNKFDAGINEVFDPCSGALRRFIFIDSKVKPQYCKPGSTRLGGSGDPYEQDLWTTSFRRYNNSNGSYNLEFLKCVMDESGNITQFTWVTNVTERTSHSLYGCQQIFQRLQREHYEQTDTAKESLKVFSRAPWCEKCNANSTICKCNGLLRILDGESSVNATMKIFGVDTEDPFVKSYLRYHGYGAGMKLLLHHGYYQLQNQLHPKKSSWHKSYLANKEKWHIAAGVTGFLAAIVFMRGCIKLFKSVSGGSPSIIQVPNNATGQSGSTNPWVFEKQHVSDIRTVPHGVDLEDLRRIICRNACNVSYYYKNASGEQRCCYMNMTGLHGCVGIVPKHFFIPAKENNMTFIELNVIRGNIDVQATISTKFTIDISSLKEGPGDSMFITHEKLGPFKDIRKYFVDEVVKGKLDCSVVIRTEEGNLRQVCIDACEAINDVTYNIHFNQPERGTLTASGYAGYFQGIDTMAQGVCGSVYYTQLPNKRVVILGIQVATGSKLSYCQKIFKSDIPDCDLNSLGKFNFNEHYVCDIDLSYTEEVHPKSPLNEFTGTLDVIGTLGLPRAKMKSEVRPTLMCTDVLDHYDMLQPTHFSPKDVSSRTCLLNNYQHVTDKIDIPPSFIKQAEDGIYNWYVRVIEENEVKVPSGPYEMDVGINGLDGVNYVDRLVGHTSGGFGHRGRKDKNFIEVPGDDDHQVKYDVTDDIKTEFNRLMECYDRGEKGPIVADYCFKDEPIKQKKIDANDVRLFNCMPLHYNIAFRMYFLPFIPIFTGPLRHLFGHAVGANPFGRDWCVLYQYIVKHGLDRIIAGDYKKFDKKMTADVLAAAFRVLKRIAQKYGWSSFHLKRMQGLVSDLVYCVVNVFNDLVMLSGNNPSGQPFTTIINGIVNQMYLMICFIFLADKNGCNDYDLAKFPEYVSVLVYGDDNIMGVNRDYKWFNHTSIAEVMALFGLTYTMADKEAESVPYIHIKNADFLKRKFVQVSNYIYAPLAVESIIKSLHVCTRSKSVTMKQQCAEIIYSANMEFFQYGEERFRHEHEFFQLLLDKYNLRNYIKDGHLPSYEEYCEKFGITYVSE